MLVKAYKLSQSPAIALLGCHPCQLSAHDFVLNIYVAALGIFHLHCGMQNLLVAACGI